MGRRQVREIRVPKAATVALLIVTTALMALLLYLLSGKAYAADEHPLRDFLARLLGSSRGPISRDAVLVVLMPVLANLLLFVPWGFFAFLALDTPRRARSLTYLLALAGAIAFAGSMYLWQQFLPTRVTSLADVVVNAAGAFAGSALGHARKSVYLRFEI